MNKEQINITITDVNDIQSVLKALTLLFKKLVYHYATTDQITHLEELLLSTQHYADTLLKVLYGEKIDEEDTEGEEWKS